MLIYNTHNMTKLTNNVNKKNILILGSGPSAREVDWESIDFDTVITTSFFYLNEKVLEKSIGILRI